MKQLKNRPVLFLLATIFSFALLTGSALSAPARVYKLRLGAVSSLPSPGARFVLEFKGILEKATDGRISVEAYHSGTLGTTTQMIQGLQDGSIEGVCVPINYYESYVPELGVLGIPMFFDSGEQAYRLCGEKGTELNEVITRMMAEKGFTLATLLISSDSKIISLTPINKFEDLKGMKIWCLPNKLVVSTMNAFGAAPVNFDTGDLAVGIQQKTIDGAYTGTTLLAPQKLYETAKYFFISDVSINFNIQSLVYSKEFTDSLPPDLLEILLETSVKADREVYLPMNTDYMNESLYEIIDAPGMTVTYADEEFITKARAAVAHLAGEFLEKVPSAQHFYDVAKKAIEADR